MNKSLQTLFVSLFALSIPSIAWASCGENWDGLFAYFLGIGASILAVPTIVFICIYYHKKKNNLIYHHKKKDGLKRVIPWLILVVLNYVIYSIPLIWCIGYDLKRPACGYLTPVFLLFGALFVVAIILHVILHFVYRKKIKNMQANDESISETNPDELDRIEKELADSEQRVEELRRERDELRARAKNMEES